MKVLLIEDDRETAEHIGYALRAHGHEVEEAYTGPEGLVRACLARYAALIVDRRLPGLDGLSLVRQLRAEGVNTPVLFLSTMCSPDDMVEGLEEGGDDYLGKPFSFVELLARINAIVRRANTQGGDNPVMLHLADLEMDLIRRTVKRMGHRISVTPREFTLLEYLLRNSGLVVTHAMLREHVWGINFDTRTSIVETHMSTLRSKMDRGRSVKLIHTVTGVGFILQDFSSNIDNQHISVRGYMKQSNPPGDAESSLPRSYQP